MGFRRAPTLSTLGAQAADSDLAAVAALATTTYGRSLLTLANQAALATESGAAAAVEQIVPMHVAGLWAVDGDGAQTNGAGLAGAAPTLTTAANSYAVADDGGVQVLLSATSGAYTSTYQPWPDVPANNDAVYFGAAIPFCEFAVDMGTGYSYTGDAIVWEYWNGAAWTAAAIAYDATDTTAHNGKRPFQQDGAITHIPHASWAATTVNGQLAYWLRARVNTFGGINLRGRFNTVNHKLVTPTNGFVVRRGGTITTLQVSDAASTLHANATVKFMLVNFTTGLTTGSLSWPVGNGRRVRFTGLSLAVTAGDVLGVVVTQEDSVNEVNNALVELGVTLS